MKTIYEEIGEMIQKLQKEPQWTLEDLEAAKREARAQESVYAAAGERLGFWWRLGFFLRHGFWPSKNIRTATAKISFLAKGYGAGSKMLKKLQRNAWEKR